MKKNAKRFIVIILIAAVIVSSSLVFSGGVGVDAATATGVGLSEHCLNAYYEGWSYIYGAMSYGAVDCSGLITLYNGVGGIRTDMMAASPETGSIGSLPRIHGLGLYQPGHVGVYVGSGMAVDARDEYSGVCYDSVYSKSWTNWFKVAGVSYPDTGFVSFNGSMFYYEDGQYVVDTTRTVDGVTYSFGSSGAAVSAYDSNGNSVDIGSSAGNSMANNSIAAPTTPDPDPEPSYDEPSYDDDSSSDAEAEAEKAAQEEKKKQEEEKKRLEEEKKKQEEEEKRLQEEAAQREADEKEGSAAAFLTTMALNDPYNQVEPETQALVANADTQDLKSNDQPEVTLPKEESTTTVVEQRALIGEEALVQQRTSGATQGHPLAFVFILFATVLSAFGFFVVERRIWKNKKHSYAFVRDLTSRKASSNRKNMF